MMIENLLYWQQSQQSAGRCQGRNQTQGRLSSHDDCRNLLLVMTMIILMMMQEGHEDHDHDDHDPHDHDHDYEVSL